MTERQPAAVEDEPKRPAARRGDEVRSTAREPAEELPWVDDRVSKVWVVLIAGVFGAILLYGILLGSAGVLTPVASPSPSPSQTPVASPTTRPTATPRLSPSPSRTGSPSPGASPTGGATVPPTGGATVPPTGSPTAPPGGSPSPGGG